MVLAFVAVAGLGAPAAAATPLSVRVVDSAGRPIRDAVVTVRPTGASARRPAAPGKFVVTQKDLEFRPFVTVVPQGALVSFPNLDPMKHHVYSFSAAKRFELKLFARDQSRSVRFDKPGVVALGCNIHDNMTAFIVVADSLWTAKTNAQGLAVFNSAPSVPVKVSVWHPYLRAPANSVSKS
ncbi:MAG TPA: methylamine utilization protein, partial [Sphingomicrobium sp.]|nr:methylamine utilization protein [Sphingomicrobium sp.]